MGTARLIMLALAAVAAGAAALLVRGIIASNKSAPTAPVQQVADMTEVLVASKDLGLGVKINPEDLRWQAWPQGAVTASYIVKSAAPEALSETTGSVVRQPMLAGEPVTTNKVVHSDSTGFMAAMLTAGMRASSVKISAETGAGGFILPNDRVDVILTSQDSDGRTRSSRTILSNVRVLAIDQTFRGEGDERTVIGKTATLELTSAQSETLAQADASGTVSLALRSLSDYDPAKAGAHQEAVGSVTVLRYGNATQVNVNGAGQ